MNLVFPLIEFAWIDLGDIMVPGTATIANNAPSIFGFGAVKQLSAAMKGLDISRPLICTDAGIVACGLIERVLTELSEIPTIFADTPPNPDETAVLAATATYKAKGCDGVIAVGGGSSLDLGKAVTLCATHEGALENFTTHMGGAARIGHVAPLIAIPTTAGTGSEVARASVLILNSGEKRIVASVNLIPKLAILDPELTLGLPPLLTAATGMDAVTHCIEAICSPVENPNAEAIGIDGLGRALGGGALLAAVNDGTDRQARGDMLMASTQGAMAFSKGLGAVHAMSHACGKDQSLKLHHGTLNAVLLPPVLRLNSKTAGHKYNKIAKAMGLAEDVDLAQEIINLNATLGLPSSLCSMGITVDMIPDMAGHCMKDMCTTTNPTSMTYDLYVELFEKALVNE